MPARFEFFAGKLRMPLAVLLAVEDSGTPLGFAELSIRPYAEDCVTDRVAYLEGWYVVPEARGQGVGWALVAAAEQWALAQGCTEFGSDALIDNAVSAAAHRPGLRRNGPDSVLSEVAGCRVRPYLP
jgi:aminoglycoside 6'-N-acetyltransferase I